MTGDDALYLPLVQPLVQPLTEPLHARRPLGRLPWWAGLEGDGFDWDRAWTRGETEEELAGLRRERPYAFLEERQGVPFSSEDYHRDLRRREAEGVLERARAAGDLVPAETPPRSRGHRGRGLGILGGFLGFAALAEVATRLGPVRVAPSSAPDPDAMARLDAELRRIAREASEAVASSRRLHETWMSELDRARLMADADRAVAAMPDLRHLETPHETQRRRRQVEGAGVSHAPGKHDRRKRERKARKAARKARRGR